MVPIQFGRANSVKTTMSHQRLPRSAIRNELYRRGELLRKYTLTRDYRVEITTVRQVGFILINVTITVKYNGAMKIGRERKPRGRSGNVE